MVKVQVGAVTIELNKNEAREIKRIDTFKHCVNESEAQHVADIWMRSAPTTAAQDRRKAAVRALGLSDEIKFI